MASGLSDPNPPYAALAVHRQVDRPGATPMVRSAVPGLTPCASLSSLAGTHRAGHRWRAAPAYGGHPYGPPRRGDISMGNAVRGTPATDRSGTPSCTLSRSDRKNCSREVHDTPRAPPFPLSLRILTASRAHAPMFLARSTRPSSPPRCRRRHYWAGSRSSMGSPYLLAQTLVPRSTASSAT